MIRKFFAALGAVALAVAVAASPARAGSAPIRVNPDGVAVQVGAPIRAKAAGPARALHVPGQRARSKAALATHYEYAGGFQYVGSGGSDGASAKVQVVNPFVNSAYAGHSLTEVAVQSGDGTDTVEVGFRKEAGSSDTGQRFFVYSWVDGVPQGYNVNFTPVSGVAHTPGDLIAPSASYPSTPVLWRIGIQQFGGVWWIGMDSTPGTFEWIGYFDNALWGGTFTKMGLGQVFGEVASASGAASSTDMGTGQYGRTNTIPYSTNLSAAYVNSWTLYNPPSGITHSLTCEDTDTSLYRSSVGPTQTGYRSFYYGGKGVGGQIGS